ncbi:MAG: tetratricopeptide repeat protein [Propionibacteriaceae bacterium]|nr:tetratricopeptide repeat protein [Propionibacteriaceae bacterium]
MANTEPVWIASQIEVMASYGVPYAYEQAVKLSGNDPMYHMKHGIALYKAAIEDQRKRQAKAEGKKPEEIELDLKGVNFDPARSELEAAVKLQPALFRAYYYLGRIYRDMDEAAQAAEAFTKSIQNGPREDEPYVALGELYRRWDYTDEAIQVLAQGKQNVPGGPSDIIFALGLAYDDKGEVDKAIDEYTDAIDRDKSQNRAKYMRGLAYFKKAEGSTSKTEKTALYTKAKSDLEDFQKNAKDEFSKGIASKTLMDIMARQM